jgi:5-methyltetrahydropteroyltriglutamate--homocysteine methyltransferase
MADALLQTTVVGSYPQPDWLVNRQMLSKVVPRTRMREIWRVPETFLEQAQDDATLIAIRDMERAGIDIVTDGEMRRESYSNRFATALDGIDDEHPAEIVNARGQKTPVPRVVGKIRRTGPVELRDMQFLRANTDKLAKITLPGPFTMGQQVKDEFYKDAEAMCMDYAAAVNEEAHALVKAGADVIQLDEPCFNIYLDEVVAWGIETLEQALDGVRAQTAVHICYGYGTPAVLAWKMKNTDWGHYGVTLPLLARSRVDQVSVECAASGVDVAVLGELRGKDVLLGVVDVGTEEIEPAGVVAERIRRALAYVAPEHLKPCTDCGLVPRSRESALGKMRSLAEGAAMVAREMAAPPAAR